MPNPENLKAPWKPGESGNPSGKARGTASKVPLLRKYALCTEAELREMRGNHAYPMIDRIAIQDILDAFDTQSEQVRVDSEGNESKGGIGARARYTEMLTDRLDGKATQHTESTVEVKSATVLEDRRTNPEHPTQKESE